MTAPERSDPDRERERILLAGLTLHGSAVVAVAAYVLLTAGRPHAALPTVALVAAVGFLGIAGTPRRHLTRPGRWNLVVAVWAGGCTLAVGAGVVADGGDSPVVMLFVLPLLFFALAVSGRVARALTLFTLLVAATSLAVADGTDPGQAVIVTTTLVLTAGYTLWRVGPHEQAAARLKAMSHTDPLTGSLNRRGFEAALADAAAAHARGELAGFTLVVVELDRLEAVNDRDGHAADDAVLRRVAAAMRTALRTGDQVGRLGGDEFAALLGGSAAPSAGPGARIDAALEVVGIAASVGAAHFPADAADADTLQHVADRALYAAKRAAAGG